MTAESRKFFNRGAVLPKGRAAVRATAEMATSM